MPFPGIVVTSLIFKEITFSFEQYETIALAKGCVESFSMLYKIDNNLSSKLFTFTTLN